MISVDFGFIVVFTDESAVLCVVPSCVKVAGKLHAVPSSLWKATVTETGAEDVLARLIAVLQPPPAAM
jgi:hypothetical protein